MSETSGQRLKQARIAAGFKTPTEAHRRFGWPVSTINAHENGQNGIRAKVAAEYARAYGVPADWLLMLDGSAGPGAPEIALATGDIVPVRVAGVTEAGLFRETDAFVMVEDVTIYEPRDKRFPQARLLAFEVSGDSMNELKPRPILPGDRVIGVDFEDLDGRYPLQDENVVVIERLRDGGQLREWSLKQVELHRNETHFCPRSTNRRHKPIIVKHDLQADDGSSIRVLALITAARSAMPL